MSDPPPPPPGRGSGSLPDSSPGLHGSGSVASKSNPSSNSSNGANTSSPSTPTPKRSLHRKQPTLSTYQTTPITKHYEINKQILAAFESSYGSQLYQVAYAFGLQFVETALLEIPKHGYYYSSRHETERLQSSVEAARVANMLLELQRADEVNLSGVTVAGAERLEQLSNLALEQIEQASSDQFETIRQRAESKLRQLADEDSWVVCEPLFDYTESLSDFMCPPAPAPSTQPALLKAAPQEWQETSKKTEPKTTEKSPTALVPSSSSEKPLSKPGAHHVSQPVDDYLLEKALFLSGLEISLGQMEGEENEERMPPPTEPLTSAISSGPLRQSAYLEMNTLAFLYHEDFDSLRSVGRVRVSTIDTYQGREPGSTNGCTVIAPLLCIHHLLDSAMPDPGLPDGTIRQVIDFETPAILHQLRESLGLSPQAFLIPSDVHQYLIENGQLAQEQFIDVIGGNIMDEGHLSSMIELLKTTPKKLACSLFFHEHVVSILKLPRNETSYWFDVIDSLPLKETLSRCHESPDEFAARMGLSPEQAIKIIGETSLPLTVRMRCLDPEALKACLQWHACSKFTPENINYIDQYKWNDESCDFDPRVFQAFVWGSL